METNPNFSPDVSLQLQSKDTKQTAQKQGMRLKTKDLLAENLLNLSPEENRLFKSRTANQCMEDAKKRPIPKMLFSELWFETEICFLFADTNLGKSILAVQIADSISRGRAIAGFKMEADRQKVLYFDFELSDKQFEKRYSQDFENHYWFDDNLIRIEINPEANIPQPLSSFDDFLYQSLEETIQREGAKIIVIDNLTYLKQGTEKAKDALPLMKELKRLKAKYGLSILALAHTPKRFLTQPLTQNDLQGSKMLINFCDASFAIGESAIDPNLRYIKQIKERSSEKIFHAENVAVCQLIKPTNFLQFEFVDFATERQHLKTPDDSDTDSKVEQAKELSKQGKVQREIASELGISAATVNRYLKK